MIELQLPQGAELGRCGTFGRPERPRFDLQSEHPTELGSSRNTQSRVFEAPEL